MKLGPDSYYGSQECRSAYTNRDQCYSYDAMQTNSTIAAEDCEKDQYKLRSSDDHEINMIQVCALNTEYIVSSDRGNGTMKVATCD